MALHPNNSGHKSGTTDKGEERGLGTKSIKGGHYNEINEGNAAQGVTDEQSGSGAPKIEKNSPRGK